MTAADAESRLPSRDFWRGRRVLLTGHTGFKGSWLSLWLAQLGARVFGMALAPHTDPSLFSAASLDALVDSRIVDIRDREATSERAIVADPEIVFHLAAQPLVLDSYRSPIETFATNVIGTLHVLEAIRHLRNARVAVIVTTDKVYANREWVYPYREEDPSAATILIRRARPRARSASPAIGSRSWPSKAWRWPARAPAM